MAVRQLLIVCGLAGMAFGCGRSPAIPAEPKATPLQPTPERPVALQYKGRRGIYDLVFLAGDGGQQKRISADESTLVVAACPRFRTAGVIRKAAGEKPLELAIYGSDGGELLKTRLGKLFEEGVLTYQLYVGSRGQALVVATMVPARELFREKPGPEPKRTVRAWWLPARGKALKLSGLPVAESGFVDMTGGFVLVERTPDGMRNLLRYRSDGRLYWSRTVSFRPALQPSTAERCDFAVRGRGFVAHFYSHGAINMETRPHDPVAFLAANPAYVKRAGTFYEQKYLPAAVKQLAAAVDLGNAEKLQVSKALKAFIYEYLASYAVRGPGRGLYRDMRGMVERLDARVGAVLKGKRMGAFVKWRKSRTGNALAFLFRTGDKCSPLPREMFAPVTLPDRTAEGPVKLKLGADLSVEVTNTGDSGSHHGFQGIGPEAARVRQ